MDDAQAARREEARIKRLPRAQKLALAVARRRRHLQELFISRD
jgi:predicted GIY-YIG superfamily endonuclease